MFPAHEDGTGCEAMSGTLRFPRRDIWGLRLVISFVEFFVQSGIAGLSACPFVFLYLYSFRVVVVRPADGTSPGGEVCKGTRVFLLPNLLRVDHTNPSNRRSGIPWRSRGLT